MLPIVGGITPCDMCYERGNYSCSDYGKVYCKDCSTKVHKHPQRQHHTPKFIQESDTTPESNDILVDSDVSDSSQSSNCDYSFNDSPNTSLLFDEIDERDDEYSGNSAAQQSKLRKLSRQYLISAG